MSEQYLWYLYVHIPDVMNAIRSHISMDSIEPSYSSLFATCKLLYIACPRLAAYHNMCEVNIIKWQSMTTQFMPYSYIIQLGVSKSPLTIRSVTTCLLLGITFAWLTCTDFARADKLVRRSSKQFRTTADMRIYDTKEIIMQLKCCRNTGHIGDALLSLVMVSLSKTIDLLYIVLVCCIINHTDADLVRLIPWHLVVECRCLRKLLIANRITIEIDAEHDLDMYHRYRRSLCLAIPHNDTGYELIRMRHISI